MLQKIIDCIQCDLDDVEVEHIPHTNSHELAIWLLKQDEVKITSKKFDEVVNILGIEAEDEQEDSE